MVKLTDEQRPAYEARNRRLLAAVLAGVPYPLIALSAMSAVPIAPSATSEVPTALAAISLLPTASAASCAAPTLAGSSIAPGIRPVIVVVF